MCLVKRTQNVRLAVAQAGLSTAQVTTRAKRKQRALSTAELEEQLNKLREEELRWNVMHQHIQARMAMLQQEQAPRAVPVVVVPPAARPIKHRPRPIVVDDDAYTDEEDGEYR